MAKVVVTIELDNEAYTKEYGPGSKFWEKYHTTRVLDGGQNEFGPTYRNVPLPASEYKSLEGQLLRDTIIEILREGFYDYQSDDRQWLKLSIDGKDVRQCCGTVEGDKHRDWCNSIAGPEASEA